MSWHWLSSRPIASDRAAGVERCAAQLRHLTAEPWEFFATSRAAVQAALAEDAAVASRGSLLAALDSWRRQVVSKAATAEPEGSSAHARLNDALAGQPRGMAASVTEILNLTESALESLLSHSSAGQTVDFDELYQAGRAFVRLGRPVFEIAEQLLQEHSPEATRKTETEGALARECLLRPGFEVRFPVAVVQRGEAKGVVVEFAVEVFASDKASGVAPHLIELGAHHGDFHRTVARAWNSAAKSAEEGHFALWRSGGSVSDFRGASAGGAFAFAFSCALRRKSYPGRIIMLTSVGPDGQLSPLGEATDREVAESIRYKVRAILDDGRFDTIGTVPAHHALIQSMLERQDRLRVSVVDPADS